MKKSICCIGAGYVGGPTMAVIALKCPDIDVNVVDIDEIKIEKWNGPLNQLPVFEPGLSDIVRSTRDKNLFFSTKIKECIEKSYMIFIAVNTPTKTKGKGAGKAADLRYVESTAKTIAKFSKSNKIIVEKSTLPVRTAEKIKKILKKNSDKIHFDVISNPEFLAEGTAIKDLFKSDRVLIGRDESKSGKKAAQELINIYKRWIPREKILTSNVWSSELSKLASNAMLAQRVSSINSLSALCEVTGAITTEVANAIGSDHRIGKKFLKPSPGFGGSCFQKDILNLVYLCEFYNLNEVAEYWYQVVKINNYQRERISKKIQEILKSKKNSIIAILGWAFKKNTNDTRESSSIYIAYQLIQKGFKLNIYDPQVNKLTIENDLKELNLVQNKIDDKKLKSSINIKSDLKETIEDVSLIVILTEWDEFINLKSNTKILDTRNILKTKKGNLFI